MLLAGLRDGRAKLLHKAIDKRHRTVISRFEQAGTVDEVRALWRQAVERGEIPGGYWAAMTHPATDAALIREIFGEVHMLSHLVGAANRADIRRLAELETENRALRDKLARQQGRLRDGMVSRYAKIHELNGLLARRIADQQHEETADQTRPHVARGRPGPAPAPRDRPPCGALEERLARVTDALGCERERRVALERRERTLSEELQAVEANFSPEASGEEPAPSLASLSLLDVGGRTDRLCHLRALNERLGACFLHHDRGIDERSGLLGGLVSRADLVMFPVDCVSHEVVTTVKRLCRQMSKPFMPLRSSGMGSFVAGLSRTMIRPS